MRVCVCVCVVNVFKSSVFDECICTFRMACRSIFYDTAHLGSMECSTNAHTPIWCVYTVQTLYIYIYEYHAEHWLLWLARLLLLLVLFLHQIENLVKPKPNIYIILVLVLAHRLSTIKYKILIRCVCVYVCVPYYWSGVKTNRMIL